MRWLLMSSLLWAVALSVPQPVSAVDVRVTAWPDGRPRSEGVYLRDVRHGVFQTWHANGQLAELRHYVDGREVGRQQAWTVEGVLFLNYEVRNGRRYGLVNSKPCVPADESASSSDERREM